MLVIDIAALQKSVNQLFTHILRSGLSTIELREQYYWIVDPSKKYDMKSEPIDLAVGDLAADLDAAKDMASPSSDVVAYNLALIAPLLVYVGEEAAQKLSSRGG